MLTLHLPDEQVQLLVQELESAGRQEIGGIMMGEQLSPGQFRVSEMTFQRHGGMFASFIRNARQALSALHQFFTRTGNQYQCFNYLGEWHSHPSFAPTPSKKDHASMIDVACYQKTGANFVLLLIVRLGANSQLDAGITVYLPDGTFGAGDLVFEPVCENHHHV